MAIFLFVDESGDLDFGPKGSRFFYFGILATRNPAKLASRLSHLRYDLLADGMVLRYFHASEDRQIVRDRVFQVATRETAFQYHCIVVEKRKVEEAIQEPARFYPGFASQLLGHVFREYPDSNERIVVITDRIPLEAKRKAIEKAMKAYLARHLGSRPYTLIHDQAASHNCLQFADYCTWALHRKWRDGDFRSYERIQPFIATEIESVGWE